MHNMIIDNDATYRESKTVQNFGTHFLMGSLSAILLVGFVYGVYKNNFVKIYTQADLSKVAKDAQTNSERLVAVAKENSTAINSIAELTAEKHNIESDIDKFNAIVQASKKQEEADIQNEVERVVSDAPLPGRPFYELTSLTMDYYEKVAKLQFVMALHHTCSSLPKGSANDQLKRALSIMRSGYELMRGHDIFKLSREMFDDEKYDANYVKQIILKNIENTNRYTNIFANFILRKYR